MKRIKKYIKIIFDKICLLMIFIVWLILYTTGFVDLSENVVSLLGLGILFLTLLDMSGEDKYILAKGIIYIIGLGLIIISPTLKTELPNKFLQILHIDSTSITLLSLIMVIISMMVNRVKIKKEQDKIRKTKMLYDTLSNSDVVILKSADIINKLKKSYCEVVRELSDLLRYITKEIEAGKIKDKELIQKFEEFAKKGNELAKQDELLIQPSEDLRKVLNEAMEELKKYEIIEEHKKNQ